MINKGIILLLTLIAFKSSLSSQSKCSCPDTIKYTMFLHKGFLIFFYLLFLSQSIDGQIQICKDRTKCGYCKNGQTILSPKYTLCDEMKNGLLLVKDGNAYGVFDTLGAEVLPMQYKNISIERNIIIGSMSSSKGSMIFDLVGKPKLDKNLIVKKALNNLIILNDGSKYGLMNETGEIIYNLSFDSIYWKFDDSFLVVKEKGYYGILNGNGKMIHKPILNAVNKFMEDSVFLKIKKQWATWNISDSTYTFGMISNPLPDQNPCYACNECIEFSDTQKLRNCSESKMLKFIYKNLRTPSDFISNGNNNQAIIEFTIKIDGTTSDYKIIKSLSSSCDEAAISLCKQLSFNKPGYFEGVPVESKYILPLKFNVDNK
jgi:hypothetical protein